MKKIIVALEFEVSDEFENYSALDEWVK